MFIRELPTSDPAVRLVKPDPARDAPLAVTWLAGPEGRDTLALMGVAKAANHASSLDQEAARLQDFIDNQDHYNWMIQLEGQTIGAVWADVKPTDYIPAPAISVMLGDPAVRGQGVGLAAVQAVLSFLQSTGQSRIYARYLTHNQASAALFDKLGFVAAGQVYADADSLMWQNVVTDSSSR